MLGGVSSWKNCCLSSSPCSSFSCRCCCCFSCSSTWICLFLPWPLCILHPLFHVFFLLFFLVLFAFFLQFFIFFFFRFVFFPCLLRHHLFPHPVSSFWGITEIFLFQTFSMWFSHFYFFQTLMNAPLHHPFVTWTRSATIPLAITAVLATLDTLVTARFAQVRNLGRIMSWKEVTMSYVFEKTGKVICWNVTVIHDIFIFIHMFIIIIILLSLIPHFFFLLVRLLALGVLQNFFYIFFADVNECKESTHNCRKHFICVNTPGSFGCAYNYSRESCQGKRSLCHVFINISYVKKKKYGIVASAIDPPPPNNVKGKWSYSKDGIGRG